MGATDLQLRRARAEASRHLRHWLGDQHITIHVTGDGAMGLATGGRLDNFYVEPRRYCQDFAYTLAMWDPFTWGADGGSCTPTMPLRDAAQWLAAEAS
jgi:hypothetical protein